MKKIIVFILLIGIFITYSIAQNNHMNAITEATSKVESKIKLVEPNFNKNISLYHALQNRKSTRSFSNKIINEQDLSNMLWAAGGINRDNGGRTVPLLGDIGIYVAMQTGVFLYDPEEHVLNRIISEDIRDQISEQGTVKEAPLVFIYAIDDDSFAGYMIDAMKDAHGMDFYYGNQTAYSTQNVYLYACSNNMNSVVIGGFNREFVDKKLMFNEDKNSYLIQLVGYKPE